MKRTYAKRIIITALLSLNTTFSWVASAQSVVVKTNLPYLATATPNLGIEVAIGSKTSFNLSGGLHPFDFSETKKRNHWIVQPELRFWFCEVFNGHFIGIHGLGGQFNVGGIDIPFRDLKNLKENRYQGYGYGAGISYGYQWILSSRWNLEFTVGAGYARLHYDKYPCTKCGSKLGSGSQNYIGPTKVGLSLIYFIK